MKKHGLTDYQFLLAKMQHHSLNSQTGGGSPVLAEFASSNSWGKLKMQVGRQLVSRPVVIYDHHINLIRSGKVLIP